MRNLLSVLAVAFVTAAALAAGVGTSALTTIDTTDHAASTTAPRIEARAGASELSPASSIDTAKPLAFMLIVR